MVNSIWISGADRYRIVYNEGRTNHVAICGTMVKDLQTHYKFDCTTDDTSTGISQNLPVTHRFEGGSKFTTTFKMEQLVQNH